MTLAVTIPADKFEAAIGEMAGNFHHGGYPEPAQVIDVAPTRRSPPPWPNTPPTNERNNP